MYKRFWYLVCLSVFLLLLVACGPEDQKTPGHSVTNHSLSLNADPTPTPSPSPGLSIGQQVITPTIPSTPTTPTPTTSSAGGLAPYGQPPTQTALESLLAQKLFAQINQDRATRGLYAYTWNSTLAQGALLHSWNMYHCGFSHTCPNGEDQCTRIAHEGFAGYSDCGENIALAGPSSPAWTNVYKVQESMINEPPDGWHRIHLTSTTLHRVGVGVYVAPNNWVWFTEDLVS
ncbi:MAG TPA: CAP domain-containing protein [Ktedonobacteraceae bacterium]